MVTSNQVTWQILREAVYGCFLCPLGKGCSQKVFGLGSIDARVVLIGTAPGEFEHRAAEPFVSPTGMFLRRCLKDAGFQKGDLYLTTAVKCRPSGEREPKDIELGRCFSYLLRQLDLIRPELVITIGLVAFHTLVPGEKRGMAAIRGDHFTGFGYKVMPTWEPEYVIQAGELRQRELLKDLTRAYNHVFHGKDPKGRDNV